MVCFELPNKFYVLENRKLRGKKKVIKHSLIVILVLIWKAWTRRAVVDVVARASATFFFIFMFSDMVQFGSKRARIGPIG